MIRPLLMVLALLATAASAGMPEAIFTDPPKDAAHPARMQSLQIDSHGAAINAVFYLAAGAGPHPTVLFLHGSPGNEQNLDLAQAIRRAGWNVLTLHYRGSWGSAGTYSITHSLEDGRAALAFLRDPVMIARFALAPGKIVVVGHSMGGFIAAKAGAEDSALMGVALIAPWDVGDDAAQDAAFTEAQYEDEYGDMPGRVVGATGHSLIAEQLAHRQDWAFPAFVPGLAKARVLIVTAHDDDRVHGLALAAALKARGGVVTARDIDSDHPFSDARIALTATVLDWLAGFSGNAVAPDDDRAAILAGERAWGQAFVTGDATVVERLLGDDFAGIAPTGKSYSKAEMIADLLRGPNITSDEVGPVDIRFYSDMAIAQGGEHEVEPVPERKPADRVWTDIWVRRAGRWWIVAAQDLDPARKWRLQRRRRCLERWRRWHWGCLQAPAGRRCRCRTASRWRRSRSRPPRRSRGSR